MRTHRYVFLVLIFSMILITACQPQQPPDQVTLQLKWVHQAQFAGFYLAQEKGYFEDENLEVTFLEGGPDVDPIGQVISGRADLGIYAPEDLIIRRSRGVPVVAVSVILQRNPMAFISLADSGINSPEDILGRSVSVAPDGEIQFMALMENLGLDLDQVEFKPYSYDYEGFYAGDVDLTEVYITGGLLRVRSAGYDVNIIWPDNYGVHFYSDTIFTTDSYLDENPQIVERFLRASLNGWRDLLENPAEGVEATLKYAIEADRDLQSQMLDASIPLVHTGDFPVGWMEIDVWEEMNDILLEQKLLDAPVQISDVFSTAVLESIYGSAK